MNKRYQGIFAPTGTPLDEKERVDELGFVKQINRLILIFASIILDIQKFPPFHWLRN